MTIRYPDPRGRYPPYALEVDRALRAGERVALLGWKLDPAWKRLPSEILARRREAAGNAWLPDPSPPLLEHLGFVLNHPEADAMRQLPPS